MKAAILTTMLALLLLDVAPTPVPGGCCGGSGLNHSGKEATRSAEADPNEIPADATPETLERDEATR